MGQLSPGHVQALLCSQSRTDVPSPRGWGAAVSVNPLKGQGVPPRGHPGKEMAGRPRKTPSFSELTRNRLYQPPSGTVLFLVNTWPLSGLFPSPGLEEFLACGPSLLPRTGAFSVHCASPSSIPLAHSSWPWCAQHLMFSAHTGPLPYPFPGSAQFSLQRRGG